MQRFHIEMSQMEPSPSCHQNGDVGGRQDPYCYIRRENNPWIQGRRHHQIALHSYISLHVTPLDPGQTPKGAVICTDHDDGGLFYAYFTHVSDDVYQYLDQYGKIVKIVMETPARIAQVNRITDG